MNTFSAVGKRVPRLDAREKVTGRALYAADLQFPGMLYGKIVRCWEYAHARVKKLDFSEAEKMPGVVKILGPNDVTQNKYNVSTLDLYVSDAGRHLIGDIADQRIFTDYVKHQGDAICGIIAKTEEAAERAAKKIKVEYEPLPVYLTAEESMKPGAVQFTPEKPGNRACWLPEAIFPNEVYGYGDVDAAMKEADVVVEDTFYVSKAKQCQMEPHAYVALYDDRSRLNVWTSTQMPKPTQRKISKLFDLPMNRVKLNQTVIGGAFGGRLGMVAEPETCAMALAVPGRPVKVEYLREEDWVASVSRHPGKFWMKIGFKKDGTPVAVDAHFLAYKGAYYVDASGIMFTTGAWLLGMYKWGAARYKSDVYFTNQAPSGAFRGYGNPQTQFAMEQLVDRGCNALGMDPVEWRLKFHKGVGDDEWILGLKYPSCALDECLKRGAEAIGWEEKRKKYQNQTGTKRRGVGVGVMNHTSGAAPMLLEHTTCTIRLNEDATAEVMIACSDLGAGAHTALRAIAAETLGLSAEDVHMKTGDTDASGFDIGAHASRTTYVGGGATKLAAENAREEIFKRASEILEANPKDLELKDKKVFVKGSPDVSVDLKEILKNGIYNFADPQTGKPVGTPGQIQGYASYIPTHNSPPFGASFAEVEVDTETGRVTVLELVTAFDIGRAIHPPSVEGQMEGGVQQGLGNLLIEEIDYNAKGLCRNNSFTDYKLIGPSEMPKTTVILVEEPDPLGPYGAKGCGECGLITPIGAVANAIYHALGIQFTEEPVTQEKILKALKEKSKTI